jgi:LuxR family maltose regulon positive regulatory protein
LAKLRVAQGRSEAATGLLERLAALAEKAGATAYLVEVLALRAVALQAQGEIRPALAALDRALQLGAPAGFLRTFLDHGEPLQRLLQVTVQRDASPAYAAVVLAAFGEEGAPRHPASAHAPPSPARDVSPLVEPLSEREIEVLTLIAEGLTNREIGQRLYISPGTVKSHTASIYGKLDVHSRTQAVARARALGVL